MIAEFRTQMETNDAWPTRIPEIHVWRMTAHHIPVSGSQCAGDPEGNPGWVAGIGGEIPNLPPGEPRGCVSRYLRGQTLVSYRTLVTGRIRIPTFSFGSY